MFAIILSVAGAALVVLTWGVYLASIPAGKVPVRPVGSVMLQCTGVTLALGGVLHWVRGADAHAAAVFAPAGLAVVMGGFFLFLLSQRKTPVGDIKVAVGDKLLPFEARTAEGFDFHSEALMGQRTLFKFFRGAW